MLIEVRQTDEYARWFRRLSDRRARAKINVRIRRLSLGNPGDVRPRDIRRALDMAQVL